MKNKFCKVALFATTMLLIGALPFCFAGCTAKKYKVDYCGNEIGFTNAKESYRAGSKVTLYYDLIATDTNYSFTLDGEEIDFTYDEKKGFVIEFTMPEHDVVLECNLTNSMTPYLTE